MARYIDVDRMQDFLVETNDVDDWCVNQYNADWISSFIESQPTADVAEVVRCEKCKHRKWEQEPCHGKIINHCERTGLRVNKYSFCSYGERKQ